MPHMFSHIDLGICILAGMKKIILVALAILMLADVTYAQKANDWQLKREKGNIMVYTRNIGETGVKELKFHTQIETSLNSISALFDDVPRNVDWVYNAKEGKILEISAPNHMIEYSVSDFPWPLNDRDLVMDSVVEQDPETKVVTARSKAIPDYYPERKGIVRIEVLDLEWILTPLPGGIVDIVYMLKTDPGGNIPLFLTNLFIDKGPIETIEKMKEMLKLPEYRDARVGYIQEVNE